MCLAQGHNTVTPVKLEPTAPRSGVKHSTSPIIMLYLGSIGMDHVIYVNHVIKGQFYKEIIGK